MAWFARATLFTGLLALLAAGSGCAAVQTRHVAAGNATGQGIAYHLPRGLLRLLIVESGGGLEVTLDGPQIIQDDAALLVARLPRSGTADNNVTITVDPTTNFLAKVDATSTGRLADVVSNAVRSYSFLQGAEERVGETIFERSFSPGEATEIAREANRALAAYFRQRCGQGFSAETEPFHAQLRQFGDPTAAELAERRTRVLICQRLAMAGVSGDPDQFVIRMTIDGASAGAFNAAPRPPDYSACARGICYRPYMPLRTTLQVGDYFSQTRSFLMPDENRLMFVDLVSGVFSEQKYMLTFTQGRLTSYQQDADSEIVGLARLPGNIVGGLISGPAEALGLRQQSLTAETNYLNTVRTNIEAQRQAAEQCRTNPHACDPGAYEVIRIPLGRPAANDTGPAGDSGGIRSDDEDTNTKPDGPSGRDG